MLLNRKIVLIFLKKQIKWCFLRVSFFRKIKYVLFLLYGYIRAALRKSAMARDERDL